MIRPSLGEALIWWFKLGWISFGGPAGQIALLHQEVVERRRWIAERRFQHALSYCMVLPGPEAQQLVTYVGWLMHGTVGGVLAGALFVLPGTLVLCALAWAVGVWGELEPVAAAFAGIQPAVVAVVLASAWRISQKSLRGRGDVALAVLSFVAVRLGAPFWAVVIVAGLVGVFRGGSPPGHGAGGLDQPSVIGDGDPAPPGHPAWVLAVCLALGGGVFLCLSPLLREVAQFFTSAAFLSFGGAYAVLPFVQHGAVVDHGWVSNAQVLQGIGLAESTPGPLILVVTWVGFFTGWNQSGLGLALLCAAVATFFTFLPSFAFILAGAPVVEATRSSPKVHAPLAAIGAAVVGAIVDLGVRLGEDVLTSSLAVGIAAMALVVLVRFKRSAVEVILAGALVGMMLWGAAQSFSLLNP